MITEIRSSIEDSTKAKRPALAGVLSLLLAFALLISQGASVAHSHGLDFDEQADCEICLKFGNDDDVIVSAEFSLAELLPTEQRVQLSLVSISATPLAPRSRAPPLATL